MLIKLWQHFHPKKKVRPLPRHLVSAFNILDLSYDIVAVLLTARAKDPTEVRRLIKKHGVKDGYDLIDKLPSRRKTTFNERLMILLRRLEGSQKYPITITPPKRGDIRRPVFRPQYRYRERQ